ncbi:MAG: ferrous iron transport protein B [Bacillota bacterium]
MPVFLPQVVLVGHPNVGKSQLFNLLTKSQVVVSNYPGTTVELTRGKGVVGEKVVMVVDTPGLYSLGAISTEEQVTRILLVNKKPDAVVQVADARNLTRMLSLTLELMEAKLPLILVLNMMDEAKASGLVINCGLLSHRLGIPVIPATLISGSGLTQIRRHIAELLRSGSRSPQFRLETYLAGSGLESGLDRLASGLKGDYGISRRSIAAALLNPDSTLEDAVRRQEGSFAHLRPVLKELQHAGEPLFLLATARRRLAAQLLQAVIRRPAREPFSVSEQISAVLLNPYSGWFVLLLVLYFGFYRFVGGFGAETLVELLEERLFLNLITPYFNLWGELYLPWDWLRDLLVAEYGILTLGLRYTFAIILPIMATYFLFFSLVEDSGYLPRAAFLVNRLMEKLGLNGKAVIPLTLGFGCGTLAVLSTRTLDSRRERLQASLLLSLAVPCSAQLGLILALLARGNGILIWLGVVLVSIFAAASLGRVLFGPPEVSFCLEIPPLRLPRPGAIIRKTLARLRWYLREVMPLFIGISVFMWILRQTGLINMVIQGFNPLISSLGLPVETGLIFVYGFLRRDYGAAGLFDLARGGVLTPGQVLVAAVTLTLFLPCAAQLAVLIREHGPGFAVLVAATTAVIAWLAGLAVHLLMSIHWIASLLM